MPGVMRVTDINRCGKGSVGRYVDGSPTVFAENLKVIRVTDPYTCPHCGGNAVQGETSVKINNLDVHLVGHQNCDCDGCGNAQSGSNTVFVLG